MLCMANFDLYGTHRRNKDVNDILLHGIMALLNNFPMAAGSCSKYLLRSESVLIPRTDSSPRVASGAIDFSRSLMRDYVSQNGRLFDSLQHRAISVLSFLERCGTFIGSMSTLSP